MLQDNEIFCSQWHKETNNLWLTVLLDLPNPIPEGYCPHDIIPKVLATRIFDHWLYLRELNISKFQVDITLWPIASHVVTLSSLSLQLTVSHVTIKDSYYYRCLVGFFVSQLCNGAVESWSTNYSGSLETHWALEVSY